MSERFEFTSEEQVEQYERELSQQEEYDEDDGYCMDCTAPTVYVCQDCGDYVCGICLISHEEAHLEKWRENREADTCDPYKEE